MTFNFCKIGAVTLRSYFSCNLSRNFVATQVAPKIFQHTETGTCLAIFVVAASVAESRTFYFSQRRLQRFYSLFSALHSVTPPLQLCAISQSGSLLSLSSVLLGHSFASCWQSQPCETGCMKNCQV